MSNSTNPYSANGPSSVPVDWEVICVVDPSCQGGDFAYTVGLARHGVPELHMWARPPDGADPGADWKWSARDLLSMLNRLAQRLIIGEAASGDGWSEQVDHGLSTVHFQLVEAGLTPDLETFQAEPGVPVLAVRWSLERRAPTPERWPADDLLRENLEFQAQRLERAAETRCNRWGEAGIEPVAVCAGPWTDLLHLYRLAVLCGDRPVWLDVLETAWGRSDRYRSATATLIEMARLAGREREAAAALTAAHADAEQLCWTARRILTDSDPGGDSSCYLMSLRPAVEAWLSAAYPAVVVADLGADLPDGLLDTALGWLMSLVDPAWATVRFEIELAKDGRPVDVASAVPATSELTALLRSVGRCATCSAESRRRWLDGCARSAMRGVGAPLTVPIDMGLRLLDRTGDLWPDQALADAAG